MIDENRDLEKFVLANNIKDDIQKEVQREERKILGATLDELESKPSSPSNSNSDAMDELKAEIKGITSGIAPTKSMKLKEMLKENGLPLRFSTINDIDQLKKFKELALAAVQ